MNELKPAQRLKLARRDRVEYIIGQLHQISETELLFIEDIEDSYTVVVSGICLTADCKCMPLHNTVVDKNHLPPYHDGCTCVGVAGKIERVENE